MDLEGKRIAYMLDLTQSHPTDEDRFRVLLVTEGEPGYSHMGDDTLGQTPWYWDKETCAQQNKQLGNTPLDVADIVASSMFRNRSRRLAKRDKTDG